MPLLQVPLLGPSKVSRKPCLPFPSESPRLLRPLAPCGPHFHLYGLEDPLPEVTDFGVDAWLLGQGTASAPAHNATEPPAWGPRDAVLTHEGATTVALAGEGEAWLEVLPDGHGCGHCHLA